MKIKAAVLRSMAHPAPYAQSRPLEITEVELDPPGPGEVLVRIKVAGLCHSDLSVITGDRPRGLPMVLGHESSAEVVEAGPGVNDLRPGDHVVTVFVPSCGCCAPCMRGRPALCEPGAAANAQGTLLSGEHRLHLDGEALNHHIGVSCFAEYAVISRRSCVKIMTDLTHREAALFGCAVLTGAGAVINRARVRAGDTTAVVGLGGVGLSALMACVANGARRVVAVDLSDEKLALARELGATHLINPRDTANTSDLLDAAGGRVDHAFDMAGAVPAFEAAYALTDRGGTTITSGLPNPSHAFKLPLSQMVGEEREIKGSYLGSGQPTVDITRYIDLYKAGRLPVNRLMGQTFMLDQVNEGFDHLASGNGLRDAIVLAD
ncbi:alcohol dehydrogenase [Allopusillimonas soli]|uniref:Alcohol dehydrogenase catalytic domain-containing protein n=1 Tax=Allopusillimonas soli TaxID=659016 RepID=A0A853FE75_9BURK|nr:zinc-dependent alcohol dehydrogenase family protein [Allopusillimonas soli]NYT38008.1 alcohol dehydrogenase catalytic domain-containing protein [Allopusillimonas soli]TEA73902.1 alcohol dehydrogenase [Allopusillimonas soli]